MVQHIIDAERIFCYRALCIARKDTTSVPGFDEDVYAAESKAYKRDWQQMIQEFIFVRQSSELLFSSFDEEQLQSPGISNNQPTYVLALGYILIGHVVHHSNILLERYLKV